MPQAYSNTSLGPKNVVTLSSGSGTYIPSSGTAAIRVRMVGGGGGGAYSTVAAGDGGTTSFGTLNCTGGIRGSYTTANAVGNGFPCGGYGGTVTGSVISGSKVVISIEGGSGTAGGSVNSYNANGGEGGTGAASYFGAGGGGGGPNISGQAYGSGGGGWYTGGGGGSGGYAEFFIFNPAPSYSYQVGAAGNAGTSSGFGGAGVIIIEEY